MGSDIFNQGNLGDADVWRAGALREAVSHVPGLAHFFSIRNRPYTIGGFVETAGES